MGSRKLSPHPQCYWALQTISHNGNNYTEQHASRRLPTPRIVAGRTAPHQGPDRLGRGRTAGCSLMHACRVRRLWLSPHGNRIPPSRPSAGREKLDLEATNRWRYCLLQRDVPRRLAHPAAHESTCTHGGLPSGARQQGDDSLRQSSHDRGRRLNTPCYGAQENTHTDRHEGSSLI